jgi:hypothetical protein
MTYNLTQRDLLRLLDFARRSFLEIPNGLALVDAKKPLAENELIAVAWFNSVVTLLTSEKVIAFDAVTVEYIEPSSTPQEDDYT